MGSRYKKREYRAWPMDFKLLELLPDEGLIGGVHYKGRRASDLVKSINEEVGENIVTVNQVQTRLRLMREAGKVNKFPASGGDIWARLSAGKAMINKTEERTDDRQEGQSEHTDS